MTPVGKRRITDDLPGRVAARWKKSAANVPEVELIPLPPIRPLKNDWSCTGGIRIAVGLMLNLSDDSPSVNWTNTPIKRAVGSDLEDDVLVRVGTIDTADEHRRRAAEEAFRIERDAVPVHQARRSCPASWPPSGCWDRSGSSPC